MSSSFWAQRKKQIAKPALLAVSAFGMMMGLSLVCVGIMVVFSAPGDDLLAFCFLLVFVGMLLILALYLVYTSYLMFRGRAFGAIELMTGLLAMSIFGSIINPVYRFAVPLVSGTQARTLIGLASCFAALLPSLLVYWICTRLLRRLVEVAYSPKAFRDG